MKIKKNRQYKSVKKSHASPGSKPCFLNQKWRSSLQNKPKKQS